MLTLPSMCVGTLDNQFSDSEDEDEDDLMGPDAAAELATGPSRLGYDALCALAISNQERLPSWLRPLYNPLSIFAEEFIDSYLRKPGLKELRFIHDLTPRGTHRRCRMIRFQQVLEHAFDQSTSKTETQYISKYLGVMEEGLQEDDAFFWLPRELRR